jgi:hypothetical protein
LLVYQGTFFANKVLLGFDDDAIILPGTDLLTLEDVFYDTNSRLNLFKEEDDDTTQVRFKFSLKMSIDQFCEIEHISQTINQNELKLYRNILDTWKYILIMF